VWGEDALTQAKSLTFFAMVLCSTQPSYDNYTIPGVFWKFNGFGSPGVTKKKGKIKKKT